MKIDYVSGLTGAPLGFTFALVMYAMVYYRAIQDRRSGLYVDDREVRYTSLTLIAYLCLFAAFLAYYFRREPCRSSLFGGFIVGSSAYALAMSCKA